MRTKVVYPDGTFSQSPLRSIATTQEERAADYNQWGIVAMNNGEYLKSDVYFEWAKLELTTKPQ